MALSGAPRDLAPILFQSARDLQIVEHLLANTDAKQLQKSQEIARKVCKVLCELGLLLEEKKTS